MSQNSFGKIPKPPHSLPVHKIEATPNLRGKANRSLPKDAVEAIGIVGGLDIEEIELVGDGRVGGDGRPIDEVGRRLQHIVAARRAEETKLEYIIGESLRGKVQRLDQKKRTHRNAVDVTGRVSAGGNGGGVQQGKRPGIE